MKRRTFILFRNEKLAGELANTLRNDPNLIIKNSRQEIKGIIPLDGDLLIIDAHFEGNMAEMKGLEIAYDFIRKNNPDISYQILVFSWFSLDYILTNYQRTARIFKDNHVQYNRLPLNLITLLQ